MWRTLEGELRNGGFKEGLHYKVVPAEEVIEKRPEAFVHRRKVFKNIGGAIAGIGLAGLGYSTQKPPIKISGQVILS